MLWFSIVVNGLFWGACCASLAARRNRSGGAWFCAGLLLGPPALIVLACSATLPEKAKSKSKPRHPRRYGPEVRRIMESDEVRAWKKTEADAQAQLEAEALEAELDEKLGKQP
ncbi:MAG: hypothetical protein WBE26_18700 [Phycisphaerae bacterium]